MAQYAGRDPAITHRITWWNSVIGSVRLTDLNDDHVYFALEELASKPDRYWAGIDGDGKPIMKAQRGTMALATVNRYAATLGELITWAIKKRIAPRDSC